MVERLAEEAVLDQESCLLLDSGQRLDCQGYLTTLFLSLELFVYYKIVDLWSSSIIFHMLFLTNTACVYSTVKAPHLQKGKKARGKFKLCIYKSYFINILVFQFLQNN